ncbi:hypothetical protein [Flavobacterium quisquiliarum]|uniref:Uncharacterized protein n=1 Tax=Flavobacterium quisquiliarum TaxID=1834436 RepID=A0ABV8VZC7_9FLAO|nr:hypothetical protein [Flavobacterium quisquiliarum]MBW1654593.1 hypothetical protein [Flavobacterium quisquiliarum]NWL01721.1 hypothetical protein [Flavobacterium collinsii]
MKTFLFFINCLLVIHCQAQQQNYSPKVMLAIETYAFLKGQSSALQKVALQFPSLKDEVASVQKSAQKIHGRAQRNIEQFLKEELKDNQFKILQNNIDSLVTQQLKHPIEQEKQAKDFIKKVKDKIRFSYDPISEKGIMSFAYLDAPHQEFADGHTMHFSTKNHPKAEESVLKITIPKSWNAEEAQMPETIQQFTSHDGTGDERILIVMYELDEEDQNLLLNEKTVSEMIAPGSKIIRTEKVKIDGMPALMVEIEETIHFDADKKKIRMLQFMFMHKQKLYCLQGSVGPAPLHHNLDHRLRKYEPLFRLVAAGTDVVH